MARPTTASRHNAVPHSKKKKALPVSDDSEQESDGDASTEEASSSDEAEGKTAPAKRRAAKKHAEHSDESDDAIMDESSENVDVKSGGSKSRLAVNNKKQQAHSTGRAAKSSSTSESQGSTASSHSHSNALGAVMQPRQPLQPGADPSAAPAPRSPFRTVSLNDSSASNGNSARRRLSGHRFNPADALRRQSLPSTLRKTAATAGGTPDGDSSFASSNGASPVRRPGLESRPSVPGQLPHPLRRTSAGFALQQGGGVGALKAAGNALRRNGSNTSNGNAASDLTNATLPMPVLSTEVMTSNYEEWMKMATDNKINSSNTWNFALIDYFHDMSLLRNADDGGSINFQKASCTLDGCVKIWTSRVDSVATETGKLLNGLAGDAAARAAEADSEDEEGQGEGGEGGAEGRPKKKRTKTHTTTLADSFDKIKVKDLELEFTVDPLFKKTSADFDEGGAAGLLMNHLGSDSNMRVVFDAGDAKVLDPEDENDQEEDDFDEDEKLPTLDISKLKAKFLPSLDMLEGRTICPTLSSFKFNSDRNLLDLSLFNRSNLGASTSSAADQVGANVLDDLTLANRDDDLPAPGGPVQDFFDDGAGDDWGAGVDGGYDGFGGGDDGADMSDGQMDLVEGAGAGFVAQAGGNHLGVVQRFDPRMDAADREVVIGMGGEEGEQKVFAYFDNALAKNWAGPEHWKMRRTIRRAEKEENEAAAAAGAGKGKKREKKQTEWIDFENPPGNAALEKKLKSTGRAGSAAKGRENQQLPDDMHFSSQQLLRLYLKPKAAVNMRRRLARAATRPEGEVDEHYWAAAAAAAGDAQGPGNMDMGDDDDDDGPALPFDTQFFHDEADTPDFDEDLPMGGDEFEGPVGGAAGAPAGAESSAREEEEDLLAATQGQMKRARPLYVNYAKKAKRVDVRMLKENIWKELAIEKQAQTRDVDEDESLELGATDFRAVISGLRKTYPPEKMEEISTSFCFICLLHLANEQGLRIRSEQPDGAAEVGPSITDLQDMETTARFVGGLDRLKILKEVLA